MRLSLSNRRVVRVLLVAIVLVAAAIAACGTAGFDSDSLVDTVRLFVVKADKPYAHAGDLVTLTALWTDKRPTKPLPAKLYWIPILCLNPDQDLFYLCFANPGDASNQSGSTQLVSLLDGGAASAGAGADAGADAGAGSSLFTSIPSGVDLAPLLPQGDSFSFKIPDDAIVPRTGTAPYGLAVVFNVLCAGQVRFAPRDPNGSPEQVPVLCTDDDGTPLSADNYVIGISRVYAYDTLTNANPVIDTASSANTAIDFDAGITLDHCTASKQSQCAENDIAIHVTDDSWELNPGDVEDGETLHEQIWVDYYSDLGHFDDDALLLFDPRAGRITGSDSYVKYRAPTGASDGTVWMVVHDNRGGASWITVPLHIR